MSPDFFTVPLAFKGFGQRMLESGFRMGAGITVNPKFRPVLDPEFVPASLWNRAFRAAGATVPLALALERERGSISVFRTAVLPHEGANIAANERY